MSYIYELHHAILKINYIMPDSFFCSAVATKLCNEKPFDCTNMTVVYDAEIVRTWYDQTYDEIKHATHNRITSISLEDLIECCRKWAIEKKSINQQSLVNKSLEDSSDYDIRS